MVAGKSEPLQQASDDGLLLALSQIEWHIPLGLGTLCVTLFDAQRDEGHTSSFPQLLPDACVWGTLIDPADATNAPLLFDPRPHAIALASLQMREQSEYLLEVSWEGEGPIPSLRCFPQLQPPVMRMLPVGRSRRLHRARLNFRDFVGATALQVYVGDQLAFDVTMEVRSRKLDYLDDYVALLDAIAAQSVALLLRRGSPVSARFLTGASMPISTALVQMMVLRHIICGGWLEQAIQQIAYAPCMELQAQMQVGEVGRHQLRSTREVAAGFQRGGERLRLPAAYAAQLSAHTQETLPRFFVRRGQQLAYDTPENRFVQSLFGRLDMLLHQLQSTFALRQSVGFLKELQRIHGCLYQLRNQCSWLAALSPLEHGPIPRQQIRVHRGYRELLEMWDLVDLDLRLTWEEQDQRISGPLRDLAGLYEVWCFFALWEALAQCTHGPAPQWRPSQSDSLTATLPRQQAIPFRFEEMDVLLSYQRRFDVGEEYHHSYSVALTPDYTIEVIRTDGERVLLCFDAKYRPDGALEKMHAYRDALRGAMGCYLLYPGHQEQPTLFHRHPRFPLPGVGAFPLRPSTDLNDWLVPFLRICLEQIASK